ncbi:MAG: hypothetical protein IPN75_06200 [Dechloromonas sp.]|uniref:Uncharacterized protein n=1 Tax=Candidatus Dechloromonas phosphorivorans TaxID=2899244 RepID=A0A9D7QKT8_9RHOO|nr:hypothetical protein [Candidatus Dechloromonas phosphorivorans]
MIVPPVIVLPNWLMTLPTPTFIVPPALLMLWPAEMPRFAVLAPPTLMTPLLVVAPPPARLRPNASILICPALLNVRIELPRVMVTVFAAAIDALSAAPGIAPQDQRPAVLQSPEAGFQVQAAASACCAGKARRIASAAGLTIKRN